jgi:hypothetical protein
MQYALEAAFAFRESSEDERAIRDALRAGDAPHEVRSAGQCVERERA